MKKENLWMLSLPQVKDIKFEDWFLKKITDEQQEKTFEVIKETAKAIGLKLEKEDNVLWCPKAAIKNLDFVLGFKKEVKKEIDLTKCQIFRMSYMNYKKHYADCDTVEDSYDKISSMIDVIIPHGRMKPSGVRGKHFNGYEFEFEDFEGTHKTAYLSVSKENAEKKINKRTQPAKI